jgi:REP element-mobilizing transposase RayT
MKQFADLYFTTATILNWYPLLARESFKEIIIDAFRFCVTNKRATIWAFVIMDNHIHLVWQILPPHILHHVRQNMLKFTSQTIRNKLVDEKEDEVLNYFLVNKMDRKFQIWKKRPLSIEILTPKVLDQKINYIHNNLGKKGKDDVSYKYSSASYYATGIRNWDFLY